VYFGDEEAANAADPVLNSVPDARRTTLIAERVDNADSSVPTYRFDIRYQGDDETAFFDV
jgi:protocatechuate 3,4-dioxygenase alpha subunit